MPDDRVIAGKYRLISKLSEGGMGAVWRAEHLELNCAAAVKLLDSAFTESPEALARFKREAQSAASLRSTNIVQIFDFGIENGVPYIAMELLRGQSLAERIAKKCPLSPKETALILTQVAKAVTWAHGMGIIHRDLKPGNIFLSEDAGELVVKLVDFGIAKPLTLDLGEAPVTITGSIMGTPQYMSPEQASGRRTVDHRTDIWSFGIVAFECITGYHAFSAETLGGLLLSICTDPMPVPSHFAAVPTGFDEWFSRCTHRDPNLRFLSIAESADVLRFVCGLEITGSHAMPQLYSEPPPRLHAGMGSKRRRPAEAYTPLTTTTDAPSIVTLAGSVLRHKHRYPRFLLGGLLVAGLLVAAALRFTSTFARSSQAALASVSAVANPDRPAPSSNLLSGQASSTANGDAVLAAAPASINPIHGEATIRPATVVVPRPNQSTTAKKAPVVPQTNSAKGEPKPRTETSGGAPPRDVAPANSDSVESTFGIRPKRIPPSLTQ